MSKYPPDEFDSITPSGRKGAHRRQAAGLSQAAAISLVAVLAVVALILVVGVVRIINSSTTNPEEQVAEPAATETPTPKETSVNVNEYSATVQVLNASGVAGAEDEVAKTIENGGWSDVKVELGRSSKSTSIVYYKEGFEDEAKALADLVGAEQLESSDKFSTDITLVLNSDIANNLPGDDNSEDATDDTADGTEGDTADEPTDTANE